MYVKATGLCDIGARVAEGRVHWRVCCESRLGRSAILGWGNDADREEIQITTDPP